MKKLIALLLSGAMALSVMAAPWYQPSPVSVAITVGQWLIKDRVEVFYLQVRAVGVDQQQARDHAFRLAVEQALGSLIVSETVVQNNAVIRNDIINYSAGYVHDFKIVSSTQTGQGVEMVLDVWVKKSGIEDRLLGQSRNTTDLAIDQTLVQHATILKEREQGDRLLKTVLADYPARAFDITIDEIRTRLSEDRQIVFEISTRLSWNTTYLESLVQSIDATATRSHVSGCFNTADHCGHSHLVRVKFRAEGDFFIRGTDSAFDDVLRAQLLKSAFLDSNPHIQLRIHNGHGRDVINTCLTHHELTRTNYFPARRFVHWDDQRTIVDGRLSTRPLITVKVAPDSLNHAKKVELAVVAEQHCR